MAHIYVYMDITICTLWIICFRKKNDILLEEDLLGDQIKLEEEVRDNHEQETLQICMRVFNK